MKISQASKIASPSSDKSSLLLDVVQIQSCFVCYCDVNFLTVTGEITLNHLQVWSNLVLTLCKINLINERLSVMLHFLHFFCRLSADWINKCGSIIKLHTLPRKEIESLKSKSRRDRHTNMLNYLPLFSSINQTLNSDDACGSVSMKFAKLSIINHIVWGERNFVDVQTRIFWIFTKL